MIETINNVAERWWGWMSSMSCQVGMLILILTIVDAVIKKWAWPQLRYALWLLVLVKLVLPPSFSLPTSFWRSFYTGERVSIALKTNPSTATLEGASQRSWGSTDAPSDAVTDDAHAAKHPDTPSNFESSHSSRSVSVENAGNAFSWHVVAMAIWFLVAGSLFVGVLVRFRRFRHRLLTSGSVDSLPLWFSESLCDAAVRLKLRRLPNVILSNGVASPAVFGVFQPTLLMPVSGVASLTRQEAEHILLHELAHIKRNDLLVHAAGLFLMLVYWFNPLWWFVSRRLRHLRELCCDATVANLLREKTPAYRKTLMETACRMLENSNKPALSFLGLAEDVDSLLVRLHWLTKKTYKRRGLRRATVFCTVAFLSACVLPMANAENAKPEKTVEGPAVSASSKNGAAVDVYGDPIPAGAAVRLGTTRYRLRGASECQLRLTRDGKTAISFGEGAVNFHDTTTGKLVQEIALPDYAVRNVALSPDEKTLAAGGFYYDPKRKDTFNSVRLIDRESGKAVSSVEWTRQNGSEVRECRFTPDGSTLIVAEERGIVFFWDRVSDEEILRYKFDNTQINSIDLSPDGKSLAIAGSRKIYLWNWASGGTPKELPLSLERTQCLRFSPNGKYLALGLDGPIAAVLWDIDAREIVRKYEDGDSRFYADSLAFTPDGKELVVPVYQKKREICCFDVQTGEVVRRIDTAPIQPRYVALSGDGSQLAACTFGPHRLKVWNYASGKEAGTDFFGHQERIASIQFSPDGKTVFTAGDDGQLVLWDSETGKRIRAIRHDDIPGQFSYWIRGTSLSPDGKTIATNCFDNTLRLWEVDTGKELLRMPGHGVLGGKRPIQFSPEGRFVYSWGNYDDALRKWDAKTGEKLREWAIEPDKIEDESVKSEMEMVTNGRWSTAVDLVEFSPDAKNFVFQLGKDIYCFDTETGKKVRKMTLDKPWAAFAFSPDSQRIAVIAQNGPPFEQRLASGGTRGGATRQYALEMFPISFGEPTWKLPLTEGLYADVVFSPSGKYVALSRCTEPCEIAIYESATGEKVHAIDNVPSVIWGKATAFSPDGTKIAAIMTDASVLIWNLPRSFK